MKKNSAPDRSGKLRFRIACLLIAAIALLDVLAVVYCVRQQDCIATAMMRHGTGNLTISDIWLAHR